MSCIGGIRNKKDMLTQVCGHESVSMLLLSHMNVPELIWCCRYANSAVFISEMKGLELDGPNGELVTGESLLDGHQLNNDISITGNFGILIGMLVFIRVASYVGLRLAYSRHWL